MPINPNTPVLVGVGQITSHWTATSGETAPSPQDLRAEAGQCALDDSGAGPALLNSIDRVVALRTMLDSVPRLPQPFGRCANPPATLAADLGLSPRELIYSHAGGDQPQLLVNEAAAAIHAGDARAVLIAGSEAIAAMKAATRAGMMLDWSRSADGTHDDHGFGEMLLSSYDIANGLGAPTQTYPAFESAIAHRLGNNAAQHRQLMSELWAGFSSVAAQHPDAQFPIARSAEFLSTPSAENYPVATPYLKWDVAQDAVNQGAAVILTSVGEADRLGVPQAKRIFLHGHGVARDRFPSERPDLSRSLAIELVLQQALASSGPPSGGLGVADIAHFDLYSCFPVAVLLATEALGIDWRASGAANLTVTGGLPFFGGAGNGYSMHAIASMVDVLRNRPGAYGLVAANGGFLSKEAAGVYSTRAPDDWQPVSSSAIQAACVAQTGPELLNEDATGTVEAWTVTYAKGESTRGYAFLRTSVGARVLARTAKGEAGQLATLAASHDNVLTGQIMSSRHEDGVNYLVL